jgi:hypothetical protein
MNQDHRAIYKLENMVYQMKEYILNKCRSEIYKGEK